MAMILLVTSDTGQANRIRAVLGRYNLVVVPHGPPAAGVEYRPDLVIVDVAKGGVFDPAVLRNYSRSSRRVPSLALIEEQGLAQFCNGVADFLVKPVRETELAFRVGRVLDKNGVEGDDVMRFGDLTINIGSYDVTLCGRRLDLTFTEYELLKLLASNAGKVLARETILNEVWGYDCFVGDRTVDVHIRRLRSKIEDSGRSYIETVRNVGYRFKAA